MANLLDKMNESSCDGFINIAEGEISCSQESEKVCNPMDFRENQLKRRQSKLLAFRNLYILFKQFPHFSIYFLFYTGYKGNKGLANPSKSCDICLAKNS